MMISTKGRYALRLLVDIAQHQHEGNARLKDTAKRQEISEKYLEAIVKELVQAQILKSIHGRGGGYRLNLPASQIRLWNVLSIAEGGLAPVACLENKDYNCPRKEHCPTLPLWKGLEQTVSAYLKQFTLQDLLDGAIDPEAQSSSR
ncbi:Rrf2 family transcriptional regulator [Erysipelotrichaceae bacterium RD49]|nr:Rrf2 family transcriptional regulator [Erysipelotrichaceae bacterium RD49]